MSVVNNIVDAQNGGYDQGHGYGELSKECFGFLTNFPIHELAKWKKAIRTFKGEGNFGIAREAFGFNEDTGCGWKNNNSYGFYANSYGEDMMPFWNHFDTVKVFGNQKAKHDSNRTVKKMNRYGLRIWHACGRPQGECSNNAAKKLANWYMHP
jgi:hypothetical protein